MWKAWILSFVFMSFDALAIISLYSWLPNTRELLTSETIERRRISGTTLQIPKGPRYVPYSEIPESLLHAIIQLEDGRFFEHRGFDFSQMRIAFEESRSGARRLRGASTLSQQLAKNLYLTPDRSWSRKFIEALVTIKLELQLPKPAILELYVNVIDWGKNVIGLHAAAKHYFGKTPQELSLKESVFLAAIIPNPARFGRQHERIFVRRQMLNALERMYRLGLIDLAEYQRALVEDPFSDPLEPESQ